MKQYTKTEIIPGVIHFHFKTREDVCRVFLRPEEFYESPEFAGKYFTLEEYKEWYTNTTGAWTYYEDWSGFNIPSWSIEKFKETFKDLNPEEQSILDDCPKSGKYYVIATFSEEDDKDLNETIEHEIAHALFYLNPEYQAQMTALVLKHQHLLGELEKYILDRYNSSVLIDECQAYLASSPDQIAEETTISSDIVDEFIKMKEKFRPLK